MPGPACANLGRTVRQLGHLGFDGRPIRSVRRDASANRRKAVDAARALFAERGQQVTMEEVAAAAGIGKGTLYRGFPGRAQLAQAVLDDLSRELQAELLAGMGLAEACPVGVLRAFLRRTYLFRLRHLDLFLMAHDGDRAEIRSSPAYLWERQAVAGLLRHAADRGLCEPADPDLLPDAVMALLDPDLVRHHRDVLGVGADRGADALVAIVFGAAGIGGLGPAGGASRN